MMRAIVLAPQVEGTDGISAIARQIAGALGRQVDSALDMVEVWSLDDDHETVLDCQPIRLRAARGRRATFASYALRARGVDADTLVVVLHAHLSPVVLPLVRRGARVVLFLLGVEAWKPLRWLERVAFRSAWRVAAISHHTSSRFAAANPALADVPVRVCHPGVSPLTAPPNGHVRGGYALIVGRMASDERYKGHDELIECWPRVREQIADARLIVAGGGDDLVRLRERASALGVGDVVVFTGPVSDDRLAALYRDAAFFVMPSRDEGFGLVYLEAMSAGKPCIAAPGAAEEIIEHGRTGLIVRADARESLTAAVAMLFTDVALRARLGSEAATEVARRFSQSAFAERLYALLDLPRAC
ncbi:MAG TPA: glycosyltransferase family 4 protein [Vicinamibacterales bacterium]|nr:glycosyltransferase family 4 protein [Vicinamibacterales bacterium]